MKTLHTISLLDVLPESVLLDPKLKAAAEALNAQIQAVTADIRQVLHLPRLDELSGDVLDYLMEQFHIDFAEPLYMSEDAKKNLIRESVAWHRIKGTPAAVEKIAQDAFRDAQVIEWFDYGGKPYHFKIRSHGFVWTPDGWLTYLRMIDAAKNVRSWCDNYELYLDETDFGTNQVFAGIANFTSGDVTVNLAKPKLDFSAGANVGTVDVITGETVHGLRRPNPNYATQICAGMANIVTGEVRIGSKTQPAVDENYFAKSWKSRVTAGMANVITGEKIWSIGLPRQRTTQLYAGTVDYVDGEISTGIAKPKLDYGLKLSARMANAVTGNVTVLSKTRVDTDENVFAESFKTNLTAGTVNIKSGSVTVKPEHTNFKRKVKVRAGCFTTVTGEVVIGCSDIKDWDELPEYGDWLRLRFRFPNLSRRLITFKDPRDDLVKDDIKAVSNVTAETQSVLNAAGEASTGIDLAMLIRRSIKTIL